MATRKVARRRNATRARKPSKGKAALLRRVQFFKDHSGGQVGRAMEGALHLAKAELLLEQAKDAGVAEVVWDYDQDPDNSWMDADQRRDHESGRLEVLECIIKVEGRACASLGGIGIYRNDRTYGRVVEAELALECKDDLRAAMRGTKRTNPRRSLGRKRNPKYHVDVDASRLIESDGPLGFDIDVTPTEHGHHVAIDVGAHRHHLGFNVRAHQLPAPSEVPTMEGDPEPPPPSPAPEGTVSNPRRHGRRTNPRVAAPGNEQDATELELFAMNDADLYRQQRHPIELNLAKKMQKGTYRHDMAVKLWMYFAESAAKKYAKEFGSDAREWHTMFPVPTRKLMAESIATQFEAEARAQGLDRPKPKAPRGRKTNPRRAKRLGRRANSAGFRPGDRVQLHPATDLWMRGARYGTVVAVGRKYVTVHVDRLGRNVKIRPANLMLAD